MTVATALRYSDKMLTDTAVTAPIAEWIITWTLNFTALTAMLNRGEVQSPMGHTSFS